VCTEKRRIEEGDKEQGLSSPVHCTSWRYQDVQGREGVILVEQYEEGHCKVCGAMFNLPTSEGKALEACRDIQTIAYTEVEVR
jgi:hypothetical protein